MRSTNEVFFSFLLLLLECKTYRKSGGEVLIADLEIVVINFILFGMQLSV